MPYTTVVVRVTNNKFQIVVNMLDNLRKVNSCFILISLSCRSSHTVFGSKIWVQRFSNFVHLIKICLTDRKGTAFANWI